MPVDILQTRDMYVPLISICVITYKRPAQLQLLIESLMSQSIFSQHTVEIIVTDNDSSASAKPVVSSLINRGSDIPIFYELEPVQGIPYARNRAVSLARGKYVAFIDDDEKADSLWLEALHRCLTTYDVDAVFGPVEPIFPEESPIYLRQSGFYDRPHHRDGTRILSGRTGNALVKKSWIDKFDEPFDTKLRLTGGSDSDFFARILKCGAQFCWAEYAIVHEFVSSDRLQLKWLLMRAFRGGQGHAWRNAMKRRFMGKLIHFLYRSLLLLFSSCMFLVFIPFGRQKSVWWLRKVFSNAGQLSAFLPYQYEEYKQSNYR